MFKPNTIKTEIQAATEVQNELSEEILKRVYGGTRLSDNDSSLGGKTVTSWAGTLPSFDSGSYRDAS